MERKTRRQLSGRPKKSPYSKEWFSSTSDSPYPPNVPESPPPAKQYRVRMGRVYVVAEAGQMEAERSHKAKAAAIQPAAGNNNEQFFLDLPMFSFPAVLMKGAGDNIRDRENNKDGLCQEERGNVAADLPVYID